MMETITEIGISKRTGRNDNNVNSVVFPLDGGIMRFFSPYSWPDFSSFFFFYFSFISLFMIRNKSLPFKNFNINVGILLKNQ